jgi:hypothetical protein
MIALYTDSQVLMRQNCNFSPKIPDKGTHVSGLPSCSLTAIKKRRPIQINCHFRRAGEEPCGN